ncbi:DUF1896 family protein [Bacteroides sp. 51]|uniref:DUF1896 family protein n=1 Tax=Bacteroides sp. 51 TaxID=2302938 RepID=UPI0013D055F8|nr:DUF1896 family protein [Bacteroides sp. 51]NDV83381.1 DUF1896 family protein [Bacteroides sp. 51]
MQNENLNLTDYWVLQMCEILEISHPYLLGNKEAATELVDSRAEAAFEKYQSLIQNGVDVPSARSSAREILLEGLKWSPTDFLASLYSSEFNKELSQEERVSKYFEYVDIFQEYNPNELFEDPAKEGPLKEAILKRITE